MINFCATISLRTPLNSPFTVISKFLMSHCAKTEVDTKSLKKLEHWSHLLSRSLPVRKDWGWIQKERVIPTEIRNKKRPLLLRHTCWQCYVLSSYELYINVLASFGLLSCNAMYFVTNNCKDCRQPPTRLFDVTVPKITIDIFTPVRTSHFAWMIFTIHHQL